MKHQMFNVNDAIKKAWDLIWADNIKHRGEDYRASHGHYITRSDLINQVRQFAIEQAEGKSWGSTGRCYGRPWGTGRKVRISGNLDGAVCDWLRAEERAGRITAHNFGRGHISGRRYRPVGEPITETEKRTMAEKERRMSTPRPVHFSKNWNAPLLCTPSRSMFSQRSQRCHSSHEPDKVTCPRCLKKLTEQKQL